MATEIPLITTIPSDPPTTDDPSNFDERADDFLAAFPGFAAQLNSMAAAMNAVAASVENAANTLTAAAAVAVLNTDYAGSSVSTITVSAGTKTVVLEQADKAFKVLPEPDVVALISRENPNVRLIGPIATIVGQTLTVSIAEDNVEGEGGPYSSWLVIHAGFLTTETQIDSRAAALAIAL